MSCACTGLPGPGLCSFSLTHHVTFRDPRSGVEYAPFNFFFVPRLGCTESALFVHVL